MKTKLFIVFFILIQLVSFASHNRSGEITYKYVSGYTYEITVTTYTKESSTLADKCSLTVKFGDSTSAVFNRVNGQKSPNFCGGDITAGEVLGDDVKKNIYKGQHTYPGPDTYVISMEDPNRNSNVCNFSGSASDQISFYLRAVLVINSSLGSNSSVVLSNDPIETGCVGICFKHDIGATDPDGDSLSFKLVPCYGNGAPISTFQFIENMKIDSIHGKVEWCSPTAICQYNIAILIEEWRLFEGKRYFIGSTIRDRQILIEPGPCPTAIDEISQERKFVIVPNPNNGTFVLSSLENQFSKADVYITNTLGQLVYQKSASSTNVSLEVNLPDGIYFVNVRTPAFSSVQQLVIKTSN